MCMARAAFLTALLAASALSTGNVAFGAPPRLNAVAQQKSLSMQIFWQRLLQILRQNGGYISVERFQKDFGMTLEKGAEEGGAKQYLYKGPVDGLSSIRLQEFGGNPDMSKKAMPVWRKTRGYYVPGYYSIIDFDSLDPQCVPTPRARADLLSLGLVDMGYLLLVPPQENFSGGNRKFPRVTIAFNEGGVESSCVIAVHVEGYSHEPIK